MTSVCRVVGRYITENTKRGNDMAKFDEKALEEFINGKINPPDEVGVAGREQLLSELRRLTRSRMRGRADIQGYPEPPMIEGRGRRNAR